MLRELDYLQTVQNKTEGCNATRLDYFITIFIILSFIFLYG